MCNFFRVPLSVFVQLYHIQSKNVVTVREKGLGKRNERMIKNEYESISKKVLIQGRFLQKQLLSVFQGICRDRKSLQGSLELT